jgi:hypothetical protein
MTTFEDALESVRNEEPSTTETPEITGNEGTPSPTPTDDDLPATVRDYLAKNPQYEEAVRVVEREMKGAFTPRLQEAAELRKRYEGIDENTVGAIRHLQQLAQTDPRQAAEYLRRQVEMLEGTQNPEAAPSLANVDPLSQYEPATEVEAFLLKQYQEMKTWQDTQQSQFQQIQTQQKAVGVQQEFAKLEQEFGVKVPLEDRAKAWEMAEAAGGKLSVSDCYFAMNRSNLLPSLMQKARDEASSVVQQKLGISTPGSLVQHGGGTPAAGPQDFTSIFNEMRGT